MRKVFSGDHQLPFFIDSTNQLRENTSTRLRVHTNTV